MASIGNRRATNVQVVEISKLMEKVITKLEDGKCRYENNWTDHDIAYKVGCSVSSVQHFRKEAYGKLNEGRGDLKLEAKMEQLENHFELEIKDLKNAIANLERRNQMVEAWCRGRGYEVANGRMKASA